MQTFFPGGVCWISALLSLSDSVTLPWLGCVLLLLLLLLASLSQRQKWASSVVSLLKPHGGSTQRAELQGCRLFCCRSLERQRSKLTCMRAAAEKPGHACNVVTFTHHLAASPCDARSRLSPPLVSRAMCMFSQSRPHTAAVDSPTIKQAAYLYPYCVFTSQEVIIHVKQLLRLFRGADY